MAKTLKKESFYMIGARPWSLKGREGETISGYSYNFLRIEEFDDGSEERMTMEISSQKDFTGQLLAFDPAESSCRPIITMGRDRATGKVKAVLEDVKDADKA